tara:strand:+ start:5547 stop:5756 length:210 start_codon:yes stop_codon:yes gene_type:complete
MKLIETIKNSIGDTYELYSTGKSFKSIVNYVERTNRRGTMAAETVTRSHRSMSNAHGSTQRRMFSGAWM